MDLLLAHADDQRPILDEELPLDAASTAPRPLGREEAQHFADASGDPESLPDQRWGLVVPEGAEGERLLGLIAPLSAARAEAQDAPVTIYRVPAGLDALGAHEWKRNVYRDESVPEEEVPRYLLILGDIDQISVEFQQVLGGDTFTGRLACSTDQGYEAYVAKLLRWEKQPSAETAARALFYTVKDGTSATTIGQRSLMEPSVEQCRARMEKGRFPAKALVEIEHESYAPRDGLLGEATKPDPALLFSISHGLGVPKKGWASVDEMRALQGAMSLGFGARLAGEDVTSGPFLPGGIWFFLACYGAATPSSSAYRHWLSTLKDSGSFGGRVDSVLAGLPKEGERPFVAALPQAALANPDGPLAIMSHADLAWTYAFRDMGPKPRDRPSRFQGIFRALIDGRRVGNAFAELLRFYGETSVELAAIYDRDARAMASGKVPPPPAAEEIARRANLWMLRQDLAGYLLLGDPAVRLPLARARE